MALSDLPVDLWEEILSRVPVKSIGAVRSTCKTWSTLSYEQSFTKKVFGKTIAAKDNECQVVLAMNLKVYLTSVNLHEIHKENGDDNVNSRIKHNAKLTSLSEDVDYQVDDISTVFHCDGLLLCISIVDKMNVKLVVWNPYLGQTRLIKPRVANQLCVRYNYALGYEETEKSNSLRTHKILRFNYEFEIYNFNSDSWKVFSFTPEWDIFYYCLGVSLKGNTYWVARKRCIQERGTDLLSVYLICFDFTTERFGPRLPLPFHSCSKDTVILSSVREEQLAVLFKGKDTLRMEVWVTNKIGPEEASWNKLFLAVNVEPLALTTVGSGSFFIDEKKNVVVVFDKCVYNLKFNLAYIIGKDGYITQVADLGEPRVNYRGYPLVCSYVPSLVQVKKVAQVMQQHHDVLLGNNQRTIIGFGYLGVFILFLCIIVLSYLGFRYRLFLGV